MIFSQTKPKITTIHQSIQEMAEAVVVMLIQEMAEAVAVMLIQEMAEAVTVMLIQEMAETVVVMLIQEMAEAEVVMLIQACDGRMVPSITRSSAVSIGAIKKFYIDNICNIMGI